MASLPSEIIVEILCQLPVKDLLRYNFILRSDSEAFAAFWRLQRSILNNKYPHIYVPNRICKDHISIKRQKHTIDECRIPTKPPFKKQVTNSSKSTLFVPIVVAGEAATDPEKRECFRHYQPITED
ncbi:hypothetical protein L484_013660 [Morus notabilis]|uniref:F-box domain-containing protein n=1 Tax=Morus notabilis TaxID=981085 RepID=W9QX85_9ROSA|nr:hypothetical protein L484_013660 [Morus notabilis]